LEVEPLIIVGTAGHIDHGKTTLSTTLTGVATDRLKEEQARGISIELGFAHWTLDNGQRCGLIDVPGHEKFVRQMIAGAMGVDLVLVVIAADEGIMPQTREHLDICRLLGIQEGVVVLTKVDLVDPEWLELVEEEIREISQGTFLEGKPIWHFSPHVPELVSGIRTQLNSWVEDFLSRRPDPELSRPFKMSMDRVFSMKGFGTVVTGTVTSGEVHDSDSLEAVQGAVTAKVRGIQVHGESKDSVQAGSRTAINLQGVEKSDLKRGDTLIREGELHPTSMIDVQLSFVSSLEKPVQVRSKTLLHVGTTQLVATLVLLGVQEARGGDEVLAQLRLEKPTVILPDERVVLRGFEVLANYGKTFAGGRVLDPAPRKHKNGDTRVVESLQRIAEGDVRTTIQELTRLSGDQEMTLSQLWTRVHASQSLLKETLEALSSQGELIKVGEGWMHQESATALQDKALLLLTAFHQEHPTRVGMPREEVRSRLRYGLEADAMNDLLAPLVADQKIQVNADTFAQHGFSPKVDGRMATLVEEMGTLYRNKKLEPPTLSDCGATLNAGQQELKEAADILVRNQQLVHVKGPLYFSKNAVDSLQTQLISFLKENEEISTLEFKEMTGVSRKYAIPLAEFFDAKKITLRAGNAGRRLRPGL